MRRVNRYFRQLFSSPHLWQGIRISMPRFSTKHGQLRIDLSILETIKLRGIKELELRDFDRRVNNDLRVILESLPQLEELSVSFMTIPMYRVLFQAASSGHFNVKKLVVGNVTQSVQVPRTSTTIQHFMYTDLFKQLPRLEEVDLGYEVNDVFVKNKLQMGSDLQKALCCSGKLISVSLAHFAIIEISCLNDIMAVNPHMKTLSLAFIYDLFVKGDVIDPTVCSSLTSLDVRDCPKEVAGSLLSWVFSSTKPNRKLTSLNVSFCPSSVVLPALPKLPELRKLNLSYCHIPGNCSLQSFHSFKNLEWLELRGNRTRGEQLFELSKVVGKNLHYLGLAHTPVTDNDLRNLAQMLPVLKTLDLSECEVTDAILDEWYIKNEDKNWPKLRKLVFKFCLHITQTVVDVVRLKTRNQLVVDM